MSPTSTPLTVLHHTPANVERIIAHPSLPLAATLDADRPVVQVWQLTGDGLVQVGAIGSETASYPQAAWTRAQMTPEPAWHPTDALLVVAGAQGLLKWTADGVASVPGVVEDAGYRDVAFSPDGTTLWLSPAALAADVDDDPDPDDDEPRWASSDAMHLTPDAPGQPAGAPGRTTAPPVSRGMRWDTAVTASRDGSMLVTLQSDQGATSGVFASPIASDVGPTALQPRNRVLLLDADGYGPPLLSTSGRYLAFRGNAYEASVQVFELPTLRLARGIHLSRPNPGWPYPQDWIDELHTWAYHNVTFLDDTLLIGTPTGTVVSIDVDTGSASEHELAPGTRITAVAATADRRLLVATDGGDILTCTVRSAPKGASARPDPVADFLAATHPVAADRLDEDAEISDGIHTWPAAELPPDAASNAHTFRTLRDLLHP